MRLYVIHAPQRPYPAHLLHLGIHGEIITDVFRDGPIYTHTRALLKARSVQDDVLILEDDAIPCKNFADHLHDVMERYRARHYGATDLISIYLGRAAPISAQTRIQTLINLADAAGRDYITDTTLYHAVAYIIPKERKNAIAQRLYNLWPTFQRLTPADTTIGSVCTHPITYTLPSLVEHDYTMPSTVHHRGPRPTEERRAWRLPQS